MERTLGIILTVKVEVPKRDLGQLLAEASSDGLAAQEELSYLNPRNKILLGLITAIYQMGYLC